MSAAAYLEWERAQVGKHEFHEGVVYAMAGGSVCSRPISAYRPGQNERYVYADAVVVCGEVQTEPDARDVLVNPSVVVEVPSPGTESYDRGVKWAGYQRLSLTGYLLVSQETVRLAVDAIYDGAFELAAD